MRKIKRFTLCLLASLALTSMARPAADVESEWYLDEVVRDVFVGQNEFEYYYQPSATDVNQQRAKGEVSYFLNTPAGLSGKKVRALIDRVMASYDDIKAVGEWHMTTATCWKEFRHEKNKFRFSVKRKALDDGTYYVSVTEAANYFKSLGKGKKETTKKKTAPRASSRRSTRKPVSKVQAAQDSPQAPVAALVENDDDDNLPVVTGQQRRKSAQEEKKAERAKQRLEREKRRDEDKARREAARLKKAEEKQQNAAEKRRLKQEEKLKREQARADREQARRDQKAARRQQAAKRDASRYHWTDVALWLSEKYGFTQTAVGDASCSMYSTAVKDAEMAKLAIKNALKGSNARMAVPWRVNEAVHGIETGYTVDGHVLVFTIGKNGDNDIVLTITEVTGEQFELLKNQNLNQ